jgi:hypothetical protein
MISELISISDTNQNASKYLKLYYTYPIKSRKTVSFSTSLMDMF